MLASAMDALLSPLYVPAKVRFLPVHPPVTVGAYVTPFSLLFPVESRESQTEPASVTPALLAAGALYVLCYRPLHPQVAAYRQLAREYVKTSIPDLSAQLLEEAREAQREGDWVGTVGRLWTAFQVDDANPGLLDELAVACLHFGFVLAVRRQRPVSARMARASGAALNELRARFPEFGPGHLHRAEFLAAAGDEAGAFLALREAMRLGLPDDLTEDAREMVRDLSGLSQSENHGFS